LLLDAFLGIHLLAAWVLRCHATQAVSVERRTERLLWSVVRKYLAVWQLQGRE
ncbi:hypothetical protein KI387_034847, partial [Taxus chinensis]